MFIITSLLNLIILVIEAHFIAKSCAMYRVLVPVLIFFYIFGFNFSTNISLPALAPTGKIYGGTFANWKEFPYHVLLELKKDNFYFFCGGSLVSDSYVLSSAHCTTG